MMKLIETTYITLKGAKKIFKIPQRQSSQYIIYQDDQPRFYVDLYDISIESNSMMNSLVLCAKRSMKDALKLINKRNNINLSEGEKHSFKLLKTNETKIVDIDLEPLPEEWLAYSL